MNWIIVSIKDRAIEAFQPASVFRHEAQAIRSFTDAMQNPNNTDINKHPADFDLYRLGYFDDSTGIITSDIVKLADGKQLSQAQE